MKYYYSNNPNAFFTDDLPKVIEDNGFTIDELTEISTEDYNAFFNPPDGKYGTWVDGKPVVLDLPTPDYVAIAEQTKVQLQNEMQTATYSLNMKLNLGRTLTDAEKATLNAWLDYSDALDALDLSTAPEITWPEKPSK